MKDSLANGHGVKDTLCVLEIVPSAVAKRKRAG
jgi:hypothetical protein